MTDRDYMAKLLDDAIDLGFGCVRPKRGRDETGLVRLSKGWVPPDVNPSDIPDGPSGSPQALIAANLRLYNWHLERAKSK